MSAAGMTDSGVRVLALACAVALLALAAPATAAPSVEDRNVTFLLDSMGLDAIPDGVALVHTLDGVVEMRIADALRVAAERAGDVDLAALAASAVPPSGAFGVGDVWVLEIGFGGCPTVTVLAPGLLPPTALHPQAYTYSGAIGHAQSDGVGVIVDWSTKGTTGGAYLNGVFIVGQSDWFCLSFFGFVVFFPFIWGYVEAN